ncbi:MAG: type II toxin-antitoxin system RelB/DinJ family antitoxin, partial [Oscillospiraceae bacterium]|nr:type II toxin-antitoxin system RelB/DinJ family antitoxin [Oscillospiraceae bacterium]
MAQVMINFRVDEDTKRDMELACKEMGLTMTTAFTIFAKKVGKEKRIPFEITAEPHPYQPRRREQIPQPEPCHLSTSPSPP